MRIDYFSPKADHCAHCEAFYANAAKGYRILKNTFGAQRAQGIADEYFVGSTGDDNATDNRVATYDACEYAMACIMDAFYTPYECAMMDVPHVPCAWYAFGEELV